jgi:hypothetical protein
MTQLVTGIVHDAQELTRQQLALFKSEIQSDLARTKEAALAIALGLSVFVLSAIMLCFFLVYLLYWAAPAVTLWGWFGIVGLGLAILGGAMMYAGRKKFETFNPLPDQSVQAMRENVQWLTNQR